MQVHIALNIVDEMCEAGFTLSTEVLNFILHTCDEISEYNLVLHISQATVSLVLDCVMTCIWSFFFPRFVGSTP